MARNFKLVGAVALVVTLGWALVDRSLFETARADDPPSLNGGGVSPKIDLKAQLEKGLRARRPVEFQYIADVVAMVEAGDLPRDLVDSSFLWARHKNTRQLQSFQFALQARASKRGIVTPALQSQLVIQR